MGLENCLGLLRRTNGRDDRVATGQECLQDMSGDEAAATYDVLTAVFDPNCREHTSEKHTSHIDGWIKKSKWED